MPQCSAGRGGGSGGGGGDGGGDGGGGGGDDDDDGRRNGWTSSIASFQLDSSLVASGSAAGRADCTALATAGGGDGDGVGGMPCKASAMETDMETASAPSSRPMHTTTRRRHAAADFTRLHSLWKAAAPSSATASPPGGSGSASTRGEERAAYCCLPFCLLPLLLLLWRRPVLTLWCWRCGELHFKLVRGSLPVGINANVRSR